MEATEALSSTVNRGEELNNCPFCCPRKKFTHAHFSDAEPQEQKCEAWIDYEKDNDDKLLWYAILAPEQYTEGHALAILGPHRRKITDYSLTEPELSALALGLKKVSSRLKDILKVETVHVLSLCEGVEHLHFHLIPRYNYTEEEKLFYTYNYWEREKGEWGSKKDFQSAIISNDRACIHGMWYAAYREMKFKASDFWQRPVEERVKTLECRAKLLRDPNLPNPFRS